MIIRISRSLLKKIEISFWIVLLMSFTFMGLTFTGIDVIGLNITNQTVLTRVNITATAPNLYRVDVLPSPIDLVANGATTVICNGSFSDFQGYTDIKNISATFYRTTVAPNAQDSNNSHYTNASCGPCAVVPGTGNLNGSCVCQFAIQYYAEPGLWQCNMTINDTAGLLASENSSYYRVNEVLGIAIENSVLDYGNMSVTQISLPTRENVTNTGNIPINVTVRGFGGDNQSVGENYTMLCEAGTNISFGFHRFDTSNATPFGDMKNLSNQTRQIFNLTIPKRLENTRLGNSSNSTFWRLQIPATASGVCNGTLIFGARDALNN